MANLVVEAYRSLGANINKLRNKDADDNDQGIVGERLPTLSLDMKDEDLLKVTTKFEKAWTESKIYSDWVKKGDENKDYWVGKQFSGPQSNKNRAMMDNVIFESLETALPEFIKQNPDPEVTVRVTVGQPTRQEDLTFAKELQSELADLGDELHLMLKMKKIARHWAVYLLGVAKLGWDTNKNIPTLKVIRPRKMILDPNGVVDEDGYTGEQIGEYRELTAQTILDVPGLEPGADKVIKDLVKQDLGTKVAFIEWWTTKYMCWTLDGKTVLLKKKNPHWNYDQQVPMPSEDSQDNGSASAINIAPEGSPTMPQLPTAQPSAIAPDTANAALPAAPSLPTAPSLPGGPQLPSAASLPGPTAGEAPTATPEIAGEMPESTAPQITMQTKTGVNHFATPGMPYVLLVMYNLDDRPVDETSLISQNLSNQDVINKRIKQIDKNADNMNGGLVVSLERSGLTKEQAKGVSTAIRAGGVVGIPAGDPREAVYRPDTPGLPADVYNQAVDLRQRVRGIFGIQGSSPAGLAPDPTVRGKIMARTLDTDRMGGGINQYLELFADQINNWFVQMLYVYDPKYKALAKQGMIPKVRVTIKPGTLVPKDATTRANQATQLAAEGKMSLVDLYKALDYPNAEELAVNAWLEVNAPEVLYKDDPRVAQVLQQKQQAAQQAAQAEQAAKNPQKEPSESINYKDLPPDAQAQMLAKVNIVAHPEGIAAHHQLHNPPPSHIPPEPVAPITPQTP